MAEMNSQTTDRKSFDTNPQTATLLREGKFELLPGDYSAVTGGYLASEEVELTDLNDLGNRQKGFDPQTLYCEAMKAKKVTPGGQVDDYFYQLPYVEFTNYSTGQVTEHAYYEFHNVWVSGDATFASYFTVYHFISSLPGRDQQFSYKIYSTIYQFNDVD